MVVRDFNHDGKLDLAVLCNGDQFASDADARQTHLSILSGNGDGTFAPAISMKVDDADGGDGIVAADFGRGEIDLAIAQYNTNEAVILQGDGHGNFVRSASYKVGDGAEGIVASDFNGDGKIDI